MGNERANSKTIEQWSAHLEELHARIAHRFLRPEVRERAYRYLRGLLADVRRKNSWQMAEAIGEARPRGVQRFLKDRKSTRLNSSHANISYAVFCLKKKK